MIPDPTDEIRAIRRKLAAKFDNDVKRIGADIRRQQRESGRKFVTLPKRAPTIARAAANHPMQRSGEVGRFEVDGQPSPPTDR